MTQYQHHVSGIFADSDDAESALDELIELGLTRENLHIFKPPTAPLTAREKDNNQVLKTVLVDTALGTAVGTGIGAIAEVALVAANVSLFVASPLIAPLAMLGWGAFLGGTVGAATGATTGATTASGTRPEKESTLTALIDDAIANKQVVLVAITHTPNETTIAKKVIQAAVGKLTDSTISAETR